MNICEEVEECDTIPPPEDKPSDFKNYCGICFKRLRPIKDDWIQREYHKNCWLKHKRYLKDWKYLNEKINEDKLLWLFQ